MNFPTHAKMILILIGNVAICTFLMGFFLTRKELRVISNCNKNNLSIGLQHEELILNCSYYSKNTCCKINQQYKKFVFFIVDALRIDFMTGNKTFMKKMHHLITQNSSQATIFGFRADPPTVTSQRLKVLKLKMITLSIK